MLRIVARLRRRARDDAAQVAFDQGDAGAFHRDVGAGAHRDADVGLRQRGRVVDAVAGHRDDAAFRLQSLDDRGFFRPAGPRLRPRRCRAVAATASAVVAVVAGQHDDPEALGVQRARSPPRVVALIGSATPSSPAALPSTATNMTVWPCARSASARASTARPASMSSVSSSAELPSATGSAVDRADDALAGDRSNVVAAGNATPRSSRARDDGRGERMLAAALEARREAQQLVLVDSPAAARRRSAAACLRSACRSCRRPACRPSPAFRAPRRSDQHAGLRAAAGRRP